MNKAVADFFKSMTQNKTKLMKGVQVNRFSILDSR